MAVPLTEITPYNTFFSDFDSNHIYERLQLLLAPCKKNIQEYESKPSFYDEYRTQVYRDTKNFVSFVEDIFKNHDSEELSKVARDRLKHVLLFYPHLLRGEFINQFIPVGFESYRSSDKHFLTDIFDSHIQMQKFMDHVNYINNTLSVSSGSGSVIAKPTDKPLNLLYDKEANDAKMNLSLMIPQEPYYARYLITCGLYNLDSQCFVTEEAVLFNGSQKSIPNRGILHHYFSNLSVNDILDNNLFLVFRLYTVDREENNNGAYYKDKKNAALSYVPLLSHLHEILIGKAPITVAFFTLDNSNMLYDSFYDMDKFINQSSDSYTPFILNPEEEAEKHTNHFGICLNFEELLNGTGFHAKNHSEYLPSICSSPDYFSHSELIFQINNIDGSLTNNPKQLIYCTVEVIETETGEKQNIIFDGIDNVYQYKTGVLMVPCPTIAFSITVRLNILIVARCHARFAIHDATTNNELFFTYLKFLDDSQLPLQTKTYPLKLYLSRGPTDGYTNLSTIYESRNHLDVDAKLIFPKISSSYPISIMINHYIKNEDKVSELRHCSMKPSVSELEQSLTELFNCILKPLSTEPYLNEPNTHWSYWYCSYLMDYIHTLVLNNKEDIVLKYFENNAPSNENLAFSLLSYMDNQIQSMIEIMNTKKGEEIQHLEPTNLHKEEPQGTPNELNTFDIDLYEKSESNNSEDSSSIKISLFNEALNQKVKVNRLELNMEDRQDKRKIIEETVKNDIYDTCFVKDLEESYQFLTPDEKQICWNCFHLYTAMKYIFLLVSRCYDTSQTQNDRSGYGYQSRTISAATSHSASTINDLVYNTLRSTLTFIQTNGLSFSFIQSQAIVVFVDTILHCKKILTSDQFFILFNDMMQALSQQKQSQGREAIPLNLARALYLYDIVHHWEDTTLQSNQLNEHMTSILIFNISNGDILTQYISLYVLVALLKREATIRSKEGLSTFTKQLAQLYGVLIDFFISMMEKTTDPLYDISNISLLHDIQHTYLLKRLVTCFPEPRLLPLSFSSYIDYLKLVKDSTYLDRFEVNEINTIVLIMQKMSYSIRPLYPSKWVYMTYYTEIKIRPFIQQFISKIHGMKPVKRLFVSPCSDDPLYLEFWTNLMILVLSLYHNYINDYSELYKSTLNDPMVSFVESLWKYFSPIYALLNRKILPYILRLIGKKNNPTAMKILCNYLNALIVYHKVDTENPQYLSVLNQDFYNFIDKWMDVAKDDLPVLCSVSFDRFFSEYLVAQYDSYYPHSPSLTTFMTNLASFVRSLYTVHLYIKRTDLYAINEFEINYEMINLLNTLKQNKALKLLLYNSFQLAYFHMKLKNYDEASQSLVYAASQLQWSTDHIDVVFEDDAQHVSSDNKILILSKNIISLLTYLFPSYIVGPYVYDVIENYSQFLPPVLQKVKKTMKDTQKNYFGVHYRVDQEGCWKELLLRAASLIAYKGKNYEMTMQIYEELEQEYRRVYNYELLSQLLSDKALIAYVIDSNDNTYPSYFMLERFGAFPSSSCLPNPCIFKGKQNESVESFQSRIMKYLENGQYTETIPSHTTLNSSSVWYYSIKPLRVRSQNQFEILNRRVYESTLYSSPSQFIARYPYYLNDSTHTVLSTFYVEYEIQSNIQFPTITRVSGLTHTDITLTPIQVAISEVNDYILDMKMNLFSLSTNRKTSQQKMLESILQAIEPHNLNGVYKYMAFFTGEWKHSYPTLPSTSRESISNNNNDIKIFREKVVQLYDVTRQILLHHSVLPSNSQQLQQTLIDKLNRTYLEIILPLKKRINTTALED